MVRFPSATRPQRQAILVGLGIAGLAAVIYHRVTALPFYFDDLGIIAWMDDHTLWEMWGSPGGMAYYRPLSFFLRKLVAAVAGGYDPVVHHGINLTAHVANSWLVAWLAAEWWPGQHRMMRGLAAGLVFMLFPFSYQAVPWVTALPHVLAAALVLGAAAAYLCATRSTGGGPAWWGLTAVLATLAPFAHETGLMLVPLLLLLEVAHPRRAGGWRRFCRPLPLLLPAAGYLVVWWQICGNRHPPGWPNFETLFQNGVYFLQGVAFPLEPLAGIWYRLGGNDMVSAGVVGSGTVLLIVLVQLCRKGGDRRMPWGWIGLSLLPAWLRLRFDYVINAPRLLYLPAAGIAWLWADTLARLVGHARRPWQSVVGFGCLLAAALLPGTLFIRDRMELHQMGGQMIQQVTEQALETNTTPARPALFVNLPAWLARRENLYPLGHEGVQLLPGYVSVPEIVFANSGRWVSGQAVKFGNIAQEMPYWYGLYGTDVGWESLATDIWGSRSVSVATLQTDAVRVLPVGGPLPSAPAERWLASFGNALILETAQASVAETGIRLELVWRYQGGQDDLHVFVHALDQGGQLVAQADGPPVGRMLPFWLWQPGNRARDLRWLTAADVSEFQVGVSLPSGERLPALDMMGERYGDNAVPILVGGLE